MLYCFNSHQRYYSAWFYLNVMTPDCAASSHTQNLNNKYTASPMCNNNNDALHNESSDIHSALECKEQVRIQFLECGQLLWQGPLAAARQVLPEQTAYSQLFKENKRMRAELRDLKGRQKAYERQICQLGQGGSCFSYLCLVRF